MQEINMCSEEERLASFTSWPHSKRSKCNPKNLAAAGFYFIGSKGEDIVRCFMCRKELDGWDPRDDPTKEHKHHAATCPWVSLHLEESRLQTFKTWPHACQNLHPSQFAKAGFVHIPSSASPDQVTCFSCSKSLDGWEESDNPIQEHKKHAKKCSFILALEESFDKQPASVGTAVTMEQIEDRPHTPPTVQKVKPDKSALVHLTLSEPTGTIAKMDVITQMEIEAPEVDMTVEEFIRMQAQSQIIQFIKTSELRMKQFLEAAQATRQQIECI